MDQTEHQNLQSSQIFLKKVTQLVLSLCVFSLLFSYSSWYSFFLHSFKLYFSTFPFQLILSHTMDKNFIFLICNGILVILILAKTSGFIIHSSSSAISDLDDQLLFNKIGDHGLQLSPETKESLMLEKEVVLMETSEPSENVVVEEERESHENSKLMVEDEEQETGNGLLNTGGEEEDEENEKVSAVSAFLEEEEGIGLLSTEDLNKKFDDFITRMKQEMRIEAQQQLVMI